MKFETIELPSGLASIGAYEYANRSDIKNIHLPDSLKEIDEGAFLNCTSLEEVVIPPHIKKLGYDEGRSAGGDIFSGCTNLKKIILPEKLEAIGESVFEGCKSLQSIDIPQGVKYIGSMAFAGCSSLEIIDIPKSVREIKFGAFKDCVSLKKIILHDSLIIGISAFEGCLSLSDIDFSNARESSISERAFAGCNSLKTASLYESYAYRGRGMFQNCCPHIIVSGERVKKDNGFILCGENWRKINSCLDCETLIIPSTVFTLGQSLEESNGSWNNYYNILEDCRSLKKVILPKHVREIGVGAFENCKKLSYIEIQSPETRIYGTAFNDCNAIETILVPKGFKETFIKQLQHGNLSLLETIVKESTEESF